ncbi:tricorn protease domain 2-containing protein [Aureobasidium pullulans]|nr:tricorn protease domain 2-containing protein [Aureobasidium pullulans]
MEIAGMNLAIGPLLSGCYNIITTINQLDQSYNLMPITLSSIAVTCRMTRLTLKELDKILVDVLDNANHFHSELLEEYDGIKIGCTMTLSLLEKHVTHLRHFNSSDVYLQAQHISTWGKLKAVYNESELKELLGQLKDNNALLNTVLNLLQSDQQGMSMNKQDKILNKMANQEKALHNMFRARGSHHKYLQDAEILLDSDNGSILTSVTSETVLTVFEFDSIIMRTAVYQRCMARHDKQSLIVALQNLAVDSVSTYELDVSMTGKDALTQIVPPSSAGPTGLYTKPTSMDLSVEPENSDDSSDSSSTLLFELSRGSPEVLDYNHYTNGATFGCTYQSVSPNEKQDARVSTHSLRLPESPEDTVIGLMDAESTHRSKEQPLSDSAVVSEISGVAHHAPGICGVTLDDTSSTAISTPDNPSTSDIDATGSVSTGVQRPGILCPPIVFFHREPIVSIAVFAQSGLAVTSAKSFRLGDFSKGRMEMTPRILWHNHPSLSISPDGRSQVLIPKNSGKPSVSGEPPNRWPDLHIESSARIDAVAWASHSKMLACGETKLRWFRNNESTIGLYDPATGRKLGTLAGLAAPAVLVAFFHQDRRLLCYSEDNTMRIWDVETCTFLRILKNLRSDKLWYPVATHHDMVVATDGNTRIGMYDLQSGKEVAGTTVSRQ